MILNNFSARVVNGQEDGSGYVALSHCQQYKIALHNYHNLRADARVEIDGKLVGTWRLPARSGFEIERPVHDEGVFTFYVVGTNEAVAAGLNGEDPNLGLVRVTFTPEVPPPVDVYSVAMAATPKYNIRADNLSAGVSYRSAGGTGLSGHSNQKFGNAGAIERDLSKQTVIHLRLVSKNDGPRPLTSFSTPIPPPVR